jgi:hypothetical protein
MNGNRRGEAGAVRWGIYFVLLLAVGVIVRGVFDTMPQWDWGWLFFWAVIGGISALGVWARR